jgi:HAD superfamily hydrolase (TIGR01509 family)
MTTGFPAMTARGIILDVDGTLVDSNDAHAHAWVRALAEHGHPVPFEQVRPLIGMGGDRLLPELIGLSEDSSPGRAISKRRAELFRREYLPSLRAFPRTRDLVAALKREGHGVAVASSASKDDLQHLLKTAGVDDLIDAGTSKDDAASSKPDPDVVHAALVRLGEPAANAVLVGDTPYDVEAARRAGVTPVALRCGGYWTDADLTGAAAIYDDPAALLTDLSRSPLAR